MEVKDFEGRNFEMAKDQDQFQTIPMKITPLEDPKYVECMMCFELDKEEKKQVAETGEIWLKVYKGRMDDFHPIGMNVLKPVINPEQN